jgi:two-component system, OmpR family, sensor histidine kinase ResE
MNKIATSIVGKLWGTILLLVSFVLFIFTVLMLEFLGNYHNDLSERSLKNTAATIASVVDENNFTIETTELISKILTEEMNVIIAKSSTELLYTDQQGVNQAEIQQKVLTNEKLRAVYTEDTPIFKEMILPSHTQSDKLDSYLVLAYPLPQAEKHGAVFIYQNPEAVSAASRETTKIIFLAAAIAFILTTVFAFFLSSRITYPLRKMREHAFELAKGKFDSKLPTTQNDEIGQLAVAFNQMGRQLKHHLEVINQEKEQLSSVLTSMTDAVITFNRDRTILVSNPPAELLLQKWFVTNDSNVAHPIPAEIYHMLDHVLDFEDKIEEEIEINSTYFSVTISPLYNGSNVRGAVAVIRDKTEQNRLEKMRSDFIANVSHELRTPIAMLQGYSEAILDDVVSSEEERNEMIRIIYDESQRMGRLVTDLLDLARMSSGFMKLYKNEVDAVFALERMTNKFVQVAKEKHVDLHFENLVGDFLPIEMDEDRIEQVITNLVDNAIRHTPAGNSVTVRIQKEQSYLKVDIEDTGIGIPKEDVPYVFDRFYKADKARTRAKGGTGLGLAIAKNIVEVHDGNISVTSVLGEGTTFTFYLPI